MEIIAQVQHYVTVIGITLGILLIIAIGLGVYFYRIHKNKVKETRIDYSCLKRKDSLDYVKFDDIQEFMIVTNDNRRFVAGIRCIGVDFNEMEEESQLQTMRGYLSFLNVVDNQSIQYRQTAKSVDLELLIASYQNSLKRLNEQRYLLNLDYDEMKVESERVSEKVYDTYFVKLKQMQKDMMSYTYQAEQLSAQVEYMQAITGEKGDPDRESSYHFDWTYQPLEYSTPLSEAEITKVAARHLYNQAQSMIGALRNAGVKAYLMSGKDLLEEMRQQTHPVSAEQFKTSELLNSSYDSLVVTSHSVSDVEEHVNQKIYQKIVEELQSEQNGD